MPHRTSEDLSTAIRLHTSPLPAGTIVHEMPFIPELEDGVIVYSRGRLYRGEAIKVTKTRVQVAYSTGGATVTRPWVYLAATNGGYGRPPQSIALALGMSESLRSWRVDLATDRNGRPTNRGGHVLAACNRTP